MRSPLRTAHGVRLAALIALGAFALHELRYVVASAPPSVAHQAHGYMAALPPAVAVLVLAAALATLIRGTEGAPSMRPPIARCTAFFALALLAVYAGQESLEGILATGSAGGLTAVVAGDGWLAIPLAFGLGAVLAMIARALEGVERAIARAHAIERPRLRPLAVRGQALRVRGRLPASSPLAFGLARRPPPLVSAF